MRFALITTNLGLPAIVGTGHPDDKQAVVYYTPPFTGRTSMHGRRDMEADESLHWTWLRDGDVVVWPVGDVHFRVDDGRFIQEKTTHPAPGGTNAQIVRFKRRPTP